ncbi:paraquat-inducible protein A [Rhodobacteraceae bacterium N5(2021)]|uniref:Paraquat-inducible protein A n=1 Tax=Gymnodinialimonas phycosphaerae TaxID=2841589 RepID=A0A975TW55_9RHOB|nr:paraquat-inducible protein A [Gymnodinialimonas phycosphaerae]MBY4891528.1 paraquat-inducible protein A [Gymnodinialimonas phycosphaerae]
MPKALIAANLCLLVLFPVSWMAPLMRAGLLPLFGLSEISILSGLAALWDDGEYALAALVAVFALVSPMVKTIVLTLIHLSRAPARLLPALEIAGKLAMADVFLIAVYITLAKGLSVGRVETAWGLWLFTGSVLVSLGISMLTKRAVIKG